MQLRNIMTFLVGAMLALTSLNSFSAEKKAQPVTNKTGQTATVKTAKTPSKASAESPKQNTKPQKAKQTAVKSEPKTSKKTDEKKISSSSKSQKSAQKSATASQTKSKSNAKSGKTAHTKTVTATKTNKKTAPKATEKNKTTVKNKTTAKNTSAKNTSAKKSNTPKTTKAQYGVKGAKLNYVKVSNRTYSYREKGKTHTSINKEKSRHFSQTGVASYYGGIFHGRKTASGEIFNKNAYTAAHKTLALGSYALVTNLRNGRKVVVRINDRGPFSHSRIIDLSVGSAREIGMLHSGIAKVRIEAMQVDSQGYISGKGAQSLYKLAKRAGLPLKVKGSGKNFAIKAD